MSVVYSIIFIYFLSAFGETIAWICVVILQLAFIALAGLGFYGWDQSKKAGEQLGESYPDGIPDEVIEKNTKETNMALGLMILGGILASTFFCAVCCGYSSLKTAIDCIDAAADFLKKTKRIIAVPFLFFILQIIAISIWLPSMAYVVSMNHVSPSENIPQMKEIEWKPEVKIMALYMFFGILWVCAFFEYCSTFVVMVSASTYYWDSNSM